jgi:hypothetical protein
MLALALLWGVWLLAKPSTQEDRPPDRRRDRPRARVQGSEAQAELIALRKSRATPEQLQRLQQALNDEAAKCTKRRQRGKAWSDASAAVESALAAASWDKAKTRLQAFTKRWGEDEDTRAHEGQDRRRAPRQRPPAGGAAQRGRLLGRRRDRLRRRRSGVAYLVQSAQRDLAAANGSVRQDGAVPEQYAGNRECRALKGASRKIVMKGGAT